MHRNTFKEDYEFSVRKIDGYGEKEGVSGYSVTLPHQCDEWEIVGADGDDSEPHNGRYPAQPVSKELAVAQMELFVQRAQEALEELRALS